MCIEKKDWVVNVISGYTDTSVEELKENFNDNELTTIYNYYIDRFKNKFNMLFQAEINKRDMCNGSDVNELTYVRYINGYADSHQDTIVSFLKDRGYSIDREYIRTIISNIILLDVDWFFKYEIYAGDIDSVDECETMLLTIKKCLINNRSIKTIGGLSKDTAKEIPLFFNTLLSLVSMDKGISKAFDNLIIEASSNMVTEIDIKELKEEGSPDIPLNIEKMFDSVYGHFKDVVYELAKDNFIDSYVTDDTDLDEIIIRNLMIVCFFRPIRDLPNMLPISIFFYLDNDDNDNIYNSKIYFYIIDLKNLKDNGYIKYTEVKEINTLEGLKTYLKNNK